MAAALLVAGHHHTCALLPNELPQCWGWNEYGQLGLGDTSNRGDGVMGDALPFVDLGSGRTAVALVAGSHHTCALLDNGLLKCWGRNDAGQLGLGDTSGRGGSSGEMGDALPHGEITTVTRKYASSFHAWAHFSSFLSRIGKTTSSWPDLVKTRLGNVNYEGPLVASWFLLQFAIRPGMRSHEAYQHSRASAKSGRRHRPLRGADVNPAI